MIALSDINPRQILDQRRYLVMSVVAAVASVAIIFFAIIPQAQATWDLVNQQGQEQAKLKLLRDKANQLESMNNSPLLGQIETVNLVLPSKKPLLELMASLGQTAQEAGVTVTNLELSPGKISSESAQVQAPLSKSKTKAKAKKGGSGPTKKGVESLDIEIVVEGQLVQLNSFFKLLESRAPLSTLTSISLRQKNQVGEEIDQTDQFEAEVVISSSFFVQSVSSAVETALPSVTQTQQQILDDLASFVVSPVDVGTEIEGGGLNDLFGVTGPELEELGIIQ